MKGLHRRFQVPVPSSYTTQVGRGLNDVKMVAPTQQTVERAKAMKRQEAEDDAIVKQLLGPPPAKRKVSGTRVQKRGKAARGKTGKKAAPTGKKKPTTSRKSSKIVKDIFGSK